MKALKATLALAIAAGLSAVSPAALANHVPGGVSFAGTPFNVNPAALGIATITQTAFTSTFIDFSYRAEVDNQGNGLGGLAGAGVFQETGGATFSTFQFPTLGVPINAGISGLNLTYRMYALFDAVGVTANNSVGGIDGTFRTFNIQFYVDPNQNTVISTGPPSTIRAPGTFGDDINVLNGTIIVGGFHVFGGLANGDFDVAFNVTNCGANTGFFCGIGGLVAGSTIGDVNGVNTAITGVNPLLGAGGTVNDIGIVGSGNVSFATPEPASLALVGLALAGLGVASSRRKSKK